MFISFNFYANVKSTYAIELHSNKFYCEGSITAVNTNISDDSSSSKIAE